MPSVSGVDAVLVDTSPFGGGGVPMSRERSRKQRVYPPEFRHQLLELVRVGRTPEELSREFEPSAQTIRNWMRQADRDRGTSRFTASSVSMCWPSDCIP